MIDYKFEISVGLATGREWGITITTSSRKLFLQAYDYFHFFDTVYAFRKAFDTSPYIQLQRFDSFAPQRNQSICEWFVDGKDYYLSLFDKLTQAKQEVFITGWWLSPDLYLKRPVGQTQNQDSRLDRILEACAKRGVKVNIILYREQTFVCQYQSEYTKMKLQSLHPNITVLRHPNQIFFLWSHHEKIVIIDQTYGFLGGVDLCYGRYDNHDHTLEDLGVSSMMGSIQEKSYLFPGIDYSNARIMDFINVRTPQQCNIEREKVHRMPWHDIHMMVVGDPVMDLVRHFIQYWNFAKSDLFDQDNHKIQNLMPNQIKKKGVLQRLLTKLGKNEEDKQTQEPTSAAGFDQPIEPLQRNTNDQQMTFKFKNNMPAQDSRFQNYVDQLKNENEEIISQVQQSPPNIVSNPNSKIDQFNNMSLQSSIPVSNLNMIRQPKQKKITFFQFDNLQENNSIQLEEQVDEEEEEKYISEKEINQIIIEIPNDSGSPSPISMQKNNIDFSDLEKQEIKPDNKKNGYAINVNQYNEKKQENSERQTLTMKKSSQRDDNFDEQDISQSTYGRFEIQDRIHQYSFTPNNFNKLNQFPVEGIYEPRRMVKQKSSTLIIQEEDREKVHSAINGTDIDSPQNRGINGRRKSGKNQTMVQSPAVNASNASTQQQIDLKGGDQMAHFKNTIDYKKLDNSIQLIEKIGKTSETNDKTKNYYNINFQIKNQNLLNVNNIPNHGILGNSTVATSTSQITNFNNIRAIEMSQIQSDKIDKSQNINMEIFQHQAYNVPKIKKGSCKCQILRSASSWSLGLPENNHEMSIQIAYVTLISQSKHYVYIENQFFISNSAGTIVQNLIADAIIQRILFAVEKQQQFLVVVVLPLLPGFAGEINDSNSAVMKCQLYYEFYTIARGGHSILELLKENGIQDPSQYIQFYGLRTHGVINQIPCTEIVYVHSKLMIVDDKYVIMGSANINDRSMNGNRDSEIGIIVEDMSRVPGKMNGEDVFMNNFSHGLRRALYAEHFQLEENQTVDPLNPETIQKIKDRAKKNTEIYREIFRCYPDDTVSSIKQLQAFYSQKNLESYQALKDEIHGNVVEFPLDFLQDENLALKITDVEYVCPQENFT